MQAERKTYRKDSLNFFSLFPPFFPHCFPERIPQRKEKSGPSFFPIPEKETESSPAAGLFLTYTL